MGSEHYCLRWNNHQSNLLGVFSQLLQDESLVDVTLACSEGAPIRAHKVVLSACSSYFQSLFLDHPERHPIVILKDVRFAELQTLVEFMYKGEVNVQYCQLSALLKTAESLKVKGLAEMTNQNTALREPEREPDRLRTQPSKSSCESPVDASLAGPASTTTATTTSLASTPSSSASSSCSTGTTIAHAASAAGGGGDKNANAAVTTSSHHSSTKSAHTPTATASTSSGAHKREASERCSATPPKRTISANASGNATATITTTATPKTHERLESPLPLDLYQRRCEVEETSTRAAETSDLVGGGGGGESNISNNTNQPNRSPLTTAASGTNSKKLSQHDNSDESDSLGGSPKRPTHRLTTDVEHRNEKAEDADDYEEEMDLDDEDAEADDNSSSNEMGLNMKIGGCGVVGIMGHASLTTVVSSPLDTGGGGGGGVIGDIESARSTPAISSNLPSDLTQRPASRSSRDGAVSSARTPTERPSSSGLCGSLATASAGMSPSSSGLAVASNLEGESLASTSGLGPVQSVPLSLKKEIECSEDDNSNSRHMQPRSASAGGGLGSELDYRASHESETSDSPHTSGGVGGGGGVANAASLSAGSVREQPQTPPPIYPCVLCGAAFPTQNKLTRHILSHSLKTLEYRETATHPLLHTHHLLPPDLNMTPLSQHFAYQINALTASGADPQEQAAAVAAAIEMDFAAAVAAAGGCGIPGIGTPGGGGGGGGGSSSGRSALDLDMSGGGPGGSSVGGGSGSRGISSRDSNGGLGSSGSSASTSAAAASTSAAAAAAFLASSSGSASTSSDPNSVVLCKFCGKSFPDVASLITHLPVHTGDRPFKCEFCGKAFKLRHHMKDHCRVHTGERPFRCSMCGKTFSRSTILKAHEKTHFPKYVRKYLSPSPVDTKDELPQ